MIFFQSIDIIYAQENNYLRENQNTTYYIATIWTIQVVIYKKYVLLLQYWLFFMYIHIYYIVYEVTYLHIIVPKLPQIPYRIHIWKIKIRYLYHILHVTSYIHMIYIYRYLHQDITHVWHIIPTCIFDLINVKLKQYSDIIK